MKIKTWAIFSGAGFALATVSTMEVIRAKPIVAGPISVIGLAIMSVGIGSLIYTGVILSIHNRRESFITAGVYRVVRHPLYLSGIVWAIGLIVLSLTTSPLLSLIAAVSGISGISGIVCLFLASRTEDNYNVKRFGKDYEKYMMEVPALNFLQGLRNLKR